MDGLTECVVSDRVRVEVEDRLEVVGRDDADGVCSDENAGHRDMLHGKNIRGVIRFSDADC
jgi:hypothetical protein